MIAEPYICTKGSKEANAGDIRWMHPTEICECGCQDRKNPLGVMPEEKWQPYADFEREKLKAMGGLLTTIYPEGYKIEINRNNDGFRRIGFYLFTLLIQYASAHYRLDTESGRLLKRAEFLKAVCEKEGVEWLPKCDDGFPSVEDSCKGFAEVGRVLSYDAARIFGAQEKPAVESQICKCPESPYQELSTQQPRISLWQCGRCKKASSCFYGEDGKFAKVGRTCCDTPAWLRCRHEAPERDYYTKAEMRLFLDWLADRIDVLEDTK